MSVLPRFRHAIACIGIAIGSDPSAHSAAGAMVAVAFTLARRAIRGLPVCRRFACQSVPNRGSGSTDQTALADDRSVIEDEARQ